VLDAGIHQKTVLRAVRQVVECKTVPNDASRAKRINFSQQQLDDPDRLIAIDSTYFTLYGTTCA
jgi:hypothetical protein